MNLFLGFVIVVHVIVCFFLIGVVLLQQGRSADLAGAFGGQGSQTAFGPRAAANVLTRLTTWAAVIFMLYLDHPDRALLALCWIGFSLCT
jgi:preprotein translocase subunit SecG